MTRGLFSSIAVIAIISFAVILAAQTQSSTSKGAATAKAATTTASTKPYTPSKTPWGDPDLQGYWPTTEMMGLQKPSPTDQAKQGVAKKKKAGPATPRPVMVFDPPDGRIPPMTEEAIKRRAEANNGHGYPAEWRGYADTTEDVNIYIRCITRGVIGTTMPSSYNNGNQILQIPGYVIFRQEMIHETRIIPLDGRPHVGKDIHMYMGDSRGHWDGNTLVVETTNMTDKTSIGANGAAYDGERGRNSEALKLTERFTRTDENTIRYEATIDDPKTWTKPWSIRIPLKQDKEYGFYEYACHEGNYALDDIMSGARYEEQNHIETDRLK
jgi:hypothetical protein